MADTTIIVIDGILVFKLDECLNYNHPLIGGEPYCS